MTNKKKSYCIHGLIWQTCSRCYDKSEKKILNEISKQKEKQKKILAYDYQDPDNVEPKENDSAYHFDESSS